MKDHYIPLVKLAIQAESALSHLKTLINGSQKVSLELIATSELRKVDLIIVQVESTSANNLEKIEALLQKGLTHEVFLICDTTNTEFLRRAMAIGIREVFQPPLNDNEIEQALIRFTQRHNTHLNAPQPSLSIGKTVSIAGSKGGVGATTVAVNLAVTLARTTPSPSVALMDMNTLFGEIPVFMDITPQFTWADITRDIQRLDPVFLENILTPHASGVQVLPSPFYLNGCHAPTPQIMEILINQLKALFDYVIVDVGQPVDDSVLKAVQMSDKLVLVSIQSLPCLSNTNRLLQSYQESDLIGSERIHVLLNRYVKKSDISLSGVKKGIGKPLSWILPNDYLSTMSAINHGRPLVEIVPKSAISKSYKGLARKLMPELFPSPAKRSLFKWRPFKRPNTNGRS